MPKTTAKSKSTEKPTAAGVRLMPPKDGVTVRMYRIGHGDCFLLAFSGKTKNKPIYVLIDCGYKPGSPSYIQTTAKEVAASIVEATGGYVHVAVITHEHQDHVNGITASNFKDLSIGETWLAWTEDPNDDLANGLRAKFKDKLLGLLAARNQLSAAGDPAQARKIEEFLSFELGGDGGPFDAVAAQHVLGANGSADTSMNKRSMKLFKDKSKNGVKCIRPHESILSIEGAKNLRIFALGPPRDETRLGELDPQGTEGFPSLAAASTGNYMATALNGGGSSPFAARYGIPQAQALTDPGYGPFFTAFYGQGKTPPFAPLHEDQIPGAADWRRIDKDWLYSAEQLALDINNATNNTSLVLAFELGKGGKVLLFAADAQRGNWISWAKKDWKEGNETIKAKDLLSRTVLYKVGHHGSHNATLNGSPADEYPSLGWMARGDYAQEFTAMITAVRAWAETQNGWDHPLKAIKEALLKKACGRVFQTDKDLGNMTMPEGAIRVDWDNFQSHTRGDRLYFDYSITA